MSEAAALFAVLRQSADPAATAFIERLIADGRDDELARINVFALAAKHELDRDALLGAFLHAARIGLFEMSWNVLCPGCGGVLDAGDTLRTLDRSEYECSLCAKGYEPTLDEMVEVTFSVSPRIRRIAAHSPDDLPIWEYYRQVFWGSGFDLPAEGLTELIEDVTLDSVELPPGEKALLSLQLPPEFVIVFDPVTHATQFIDVQGEPIRERQSISVLFNKVRAPTGTERLRPGPLRLSLTNQTDRRVLPTVWIAGDKLHHILGARRPFLSGKQLLSNQTFRDLFRTDALGIDQRLKITSLTFLFTDLKGSTELYDRVGDLAAFDLVKDHFRVLNTIVAEEGGAVIKTIGDAVMATFPFPHQALKAAMKMRDAMRRLNEQHGREDLLLKIGLHEGSCLAVSLNDRQDFFGQTVNIASRVQGLATSQSIYATGPVIAASTAILEQGGAAPVERTQALRGVREDVRLYEIP